MILVYALYWWHLFVLFSVCKLCNKAFHDSWFLVRYWIEPYNYFGRRGRKEPEVLTAASLKRLYVENRPYLVGGHSQHDQSSNTLSSSCAGSKHTFDLQKLRCSQLTSRSIVSMVEKYNYMKETLGQRLAFGKLNIL